MTLFLVLIGLGAVVFAGGVVLHVQRRREAEEVAERTLARLHRRHDALAARTAEVAAEVAGLYRTGASD